MAKGRHSGRKDRKIGRDISKSSEKQDAHMKGAGDRFAAGQGAPRSPWDGTRTPRGQAIQTRDMDEEAKRGRARSVLRKAGTEKNMQAKEDPVQMPEKAPPAVQKEPEQLSAKQMQQPLQLPDAHEHVVQPEQRKRAPQDAQDANDVVHDEKPGEAPKEDAQTLHGHVDNASLSVSDVPVRAHQARSVPAQLNTRQGAAAHKAVSSKKTARKSEAVPGTSRAAGSRAKKTVQTAQKARGKDSEAAHITELDTHSTEQSVETMPGEHKVPGVLEAQDTGVQMAQSFVPEQMQISGIPLSVTPRQERTRQPDFKSAELPQKRHFRPLSSNARTIARKLARTPRELKEKLQSARDEEETNPEESAVHTLAEGADKSAREIALAMVMGTHLLRQKQQKQLQRPQAVRPSEVQQLQTQSSDIQLRMNPLPETQPDPLHVRAGIRSADGSSGSIAVEPDVVRAFGPRLRNPDAKTVVRAEQAAEKKNGPAATAPVAGASGPPNVQIAEQLQVKEQDAAVLSLPEQIAETVPKPGSAQEESAKCAQKPGYISHVPAVTSLHKSKDTQTKKDLRPRDERGGITARETARAYSPREKLGASGTASTACQGSQQAARTFAQSEAQTRAARRAFEEQARGSAKDTFLYTTRTARRLASTTRWLYILIALCIAVAAISSMCIAFMGAGASMGQAAGAAGYMDTTVVDEMKVSINRQWLDSLRALRAQAVSSGIREEEIEVRYNYSQDGDGDTLYRLNNWNDVLAVWLVTHNRAITAADEPDVKNIYFAMNPMALTLPSAAGVPTVQPAATAAPATSAPSAPANTARAYIDVRNYRIEDAKALFGLTDTQIAQMDEWISPTSDQGTFWRMLVGASVDAGDAFSTDYLNVDPGSAVQILLQEAQNRSGWVYSQDRRTQRGYADCSSLVAACFRSIGLTFGSAWPTAAEIARWCDNKNCRVSASQTQPGDVILWGGKDNGRYLGVFHVALYAGDGMMWEAAPSAGGVVYRSVSVQNPDRIIFYARPIAGAGINWNAASVPADIPAGTRTITLQTTAYCEACDTFYEGDPRTASGTIPQRGTVATSKTKQFPFGTKLYVPGYGYGTVEDTGGFADGTIDLYLGHRSVCTCGSDWGRKTVTVYVLS